VLALLVYLITMTALHQFSSLSKQVAYLLTPERGKTSPIEQTLLASGITKAQITSFREQVITRLEGIVGGSLPLVTRILDFLLDTVVVAVISIYLLIDGGRIAIWCRRNLPATVQADFILDTLQRVVGGYIRGQVILATLVGLLVGIGMELFHVPYALLLGVLAFILEFIPILGTLVSGVICTLLALTQGWVIALCVLAYFIVVHVLEGDIIGPRIVGEAIGLHPIVSIAAIIAGSELFGVVGALLASPIAGMIQVFIVAFWVHWRTIHPEHFVVTQEGPATTNGTTTVNGADSP
jgi:predicted PurR-regulated permease PerM